MISFQQFKTFLVETITNIDKTELSDLLKNPGKTLIHFSNSDVFPPQSNLRGFASAFNNEVVGSKFGISVLKPKDALFFWFLKDLAHLRNTGSLWQRRQYAYLIDCPEGSSVFRVSTYNEKSYEKDILTLKNKGFNFLTSKLALDLQGDILDHLEFGKLDISLPKNIPTFSDRLGALWKSHIEITNKRKNLELTFTDYLENSKLGPAKIRTLPDQIKKLIWICISKYLNLIRDEQIIKKLGSPVSSLSTDKSLQTKYGPLPIVLPDGTKISSLASILLDTDQKIDPEMTIEALTANLDFSEIDTPTRITPDMYIEAMNKFIHNYYSIYRKGEKPLDIDHPAWKLWLTIIFFSIDKKESWKNIWLSLGYNTIIDDDPRTQITPGLEKMMIANTERGIDRQLVRLDNEMSEILILDPKVIKNVRKIDLSDLKPV